VATVLLPRSLLALFPGAERRNELAGDDVDSLITALDATTPGIRDRLVEEGPRLRRHINVFVDGQPADLSTPVGPTATVHEIPAVSGGEQRPAAWRTLAPWTGSPRGGSEES
jgi:molybdopterin synthase sulfur carrier subunit